MPLDLTADLSTACVQLSTGPGELCVEFPGGFQVCAQAGYELGDASEITKSMLAQLNTALVPLSPFFNVLDVVKAIFDCLQAIPDAITSFDPSALLQCLPALQKAVDALLKLLPPLPIFVMVKGIINVIVTGLLGLKTKIQALIKQQARILAAATRATELGNLQLQAVVDCAAGNMTAQLANLNAEFLPLNRLIGLVNVLLELAGAERIPTLENVSAVSEAALAPLDTAISVLQAIGGALP